MVYSVFLDPECVEEACEGGRTTLVSMLRGFLQNCLIAETKGSWRVGPELRDAVSKVPDQEIRLQLGVLLEILAKRNRFKEAICCDPEDYESPIAELAAQDLDNPDIDHFVFRSGHNTQNPKTSNANSYDLSGFCARRSESVQATTVAGESIRFEKIFDRFFRRLVRLSDEVTIIDYMCGRKFGENYYKNIPLWAEELEKLDRSFIFRLVTEIIAPRDEQSLRHRLDEVFDGTLVCWKLHCFDRGTLPHERFFITDSFTIDIGRGIDLVNPNTQLNRDLKIGLSDTPTLPKF
jgi:hypothetical protein